MAKGKYHEWLTRDGLLRLEGWARAGLTDEQIAGNIGICAGTLYDWMHKYPEVSEALKKGKAPVDIEVENALLRRALGCVVNEKRIESGDNGDKEIVIRKELPPDTTACIFWLKNRKRANWRDRPPDIMDAAALEKLDEIIKGLDNAAK